MTMSVKSAIDWHDQISMDFSYLRKAFAEGFQLREFIEIVNKRIKEYNDSSLFISKFEEDILEKRVTELDQQKKSGKQLPLFGLPFVIKDNIDVAGLPTTGGCPEYAYMPKKSAPAVQILLDSGAIALGKVNLDQFATGLVGTRSPYGMPANPWSRADEFIPGGSSSGSACAVSAGLCSFSLGTDTAGSGRVPAALQNIIGIKPSRGLVSTRGVIPAVRSLDCVSVFSLSIEDGFEIVNVISGYDREDIFSRKFSSVNQAPNPEKIRIALLPESNPFEEFFFQAHSTECMQLYRNTIHKLQAKESIQVKPMEKNHWQVLQEVAGMLYNGPWVAERYAAVGDFLSQSLPGQNEIVKSIVLSGENWSAKQAYQGQYRLLEYKNRFKDFWNEFDFILLPTTGGIYTKAEIDSDPVTKNSDLGRFTNFANLLDLCAVSFPSGFLSCGAPQGATLFAPAGMDKELIDLVKIL